jgi:hypothetical protein
VVLFPAAPQPLDMFLGRTRPLFHRLITLIILLNVMMGWALAGCAWAFPDTSWPQGMFLMTLCVSFAGLALLFNASAYSLRRGQDCDVWCERMGWNMMGWDGMG